MPDLPAGAVTAAAKTIADELVAVQARFMTRIEFGEYLARTALKAAAPYMICCQYDGCDCQNAGAATERERIRQMAIEHDAVADPCTLQTPFEQLLDGRS